MNPGRWALFGFFLLLLLLLLLALARGFLASDRGGELAAAVDLDSMPPALALEGEDRAGLGGAGSGSNSSSELSITIALAFLAFGLATFLCS